MDCKEDSSMSSTKGLASWQLIDFTDIELGDLIGGGGVGVIYKGYWKHEKVALKTLFDPRISEDLKKEYMDELLVMSKLNHSNVVKFLGASMIPPNLCFVMELCECSLHHLIHVMRPKFTDYDMIQMAIDVASAMEYLHSLQPAIIHRDLKTLNVLKSFNGSLKVCDFGLVNMKQSQAGTPSYMAPELFQGRPFTKSVDVYAFAILLWEIFSQEIPYHQTPIPDIRDKVLAGERLKIPSYGLPPGIAEMISVCWHPNYDQRPDFPTIVDNLYDISSKIPKCSYSELVWCYLCCEFVYLKVKLWTLQFHTTQEIYESKTADSLTFQINYLRLS